MLKDQNKGWFGASLEAGSIKLGFSGHLPSLSLPQLNFFSLLLPAVVGRWSRAKPSATAEVVVQVLGMANPPHFLSLLDSMALL